MVTIQVREFPEKFESFREDLNELADEIREHGHDAEVDNQPPRGGFGFIVDYQTIALYIETHAEDATFNLVVTSVVLAVVNWAKRIFTRAKDTERLEKKKKVTIFGPDGKPLKRIEIDSADDIEVV